MSSGSEGTSGGASDEGTTATPATTQSTTPTDGTQEPSGEEPVEDSNNPVADEDGQTANTVHEPPKERWDAILANAREKAKQEALAQFAWAKDIAPDEAEAVRTWVQVGNENPMAALDHLVRGLAQMPGAIPHLQEYFRGLLGDEGQPQGRQSVPAGDEMPQPDIPTDQSNGQPVVYSAQQLQKLLQWQAAQLRKDLTSEFQTELQPFQQDRQSAIAQRQAYQIKQQADQYAAKAVGEISNQPGFDANKAEIAKVWDEMPRNDGRTEGERLYAAYIQVVAPKLSNLARQNAVADVTRRAGATTINPNSAGAGSEKFDYSKASWADALKHEAAKRGKK
ncbi:MAG: hypothetical protein ACOYD0_11890 [Candidatus Nanopelagicales bacterium]